MVATTKRINHEVDGSDNHFSDAKGLLLIVVCSFYTILLFVLASLITTFLSSFYTIVRSKVAQLTLSDARCETVVDFNHNVKNTLTPARATKNGWWDLYPLSGEISTVHGTLPFYCTWLELMTLFLSRLLPLIGKNGLIHPPKITKPARCANFRQISESRLAFSVARWLATRNQSKENSCLYVPCFCNHGYLDKSKEKC